MKWRMVIGYLVGKEIYRRMGKKIDKRTLRAPWNETLFTILKEIDTEEEANIVVRMLYVLSYLEREASLIRARLTGDRFLGAMKKGVDPQGKV